MHVVVELLVLGCCVNCLGIRPELRGASLTGWWPPLFHSGSHVGPVFSSLAPWWLFLLLPVSELSFSPAGGISKS